MLTHRSWAAHGLPSNERLELLGDSVLGLVVTEILMERHPWAGEGDLAWMRQRVVARPACARACRTTGLDTALRAAAPPGQAAPAEVLRSERVQAGLVEALLGAAWRDLGHDAVAAAVAEAFAGPLGEVRAGMRDPKTALQEAAARRRLAVRYELAEQSGPAHARAFRSRALVGERELGAGSGPSKRASETAAAAAALRRLEEGRV